MIRAWLLTVSILGFPLLAQAQDPSIVVVEVDQKTQEKWGLFTPEYRKHFATLVQTLQSKGVKVAAFTYTFLSEPTVETQTAAFAAAAKASKVPVVAIQIGSLMGGGSGFIDDFGNEYVAPPEGMFFPVPVEESLAPYLRLGHDTAMNAYSNSLDKKAEKRFSQWKSAYSKDKKTPWDPLLSYSWWNWLSNFLSITPESVMSPEVYRLTFPMAPSLEEAMLQATGDLKAGEKLPPQLLVPKWYSDSVDSNGNVKALYYLDLCLNYPNFANMKRISLCDLLASPQSYATLLKNAYVFVGTTWGGEEWEWALTVPTGKGGKSESVPKVYLEADATYRILKALKK